MNGCKDIGKDLKYLFKSLNAFDDLYGKSPKTTVFSFVLKLESKLH